MLTYQDFLKEVEKGEKAKVKFILDKIAEHETSDDYLTGCLADEYDRQLNRTTEQSERYIKLETGKVIKDKYSPNSKMKSNYYNRFTSQLIRYVLSNGTNFNVEGVKEKLGGDEYNHQIQKLAKKAMNGARSFGFWNKDHLEVFPVYKSKSDTAVFAPLVDEETSELRGGIRYWRIDKDKPLIATLYMEDGFETWKFKDGEPPELRNKKQPYLQKVKETKIEGITEIVDMNTSSIPIFPMWANEMHQSEIIGLRDSIDSYDITLNNFTNDCQTAQLYFTVRGGVGMDTEELVSFIDTVQKYKVLNPAEGQEVTPTTVEVPSQAREILLERIKNQMYEDFGALNIAELRAGNVTATQIEAAYEAMDLRASGLETQVMDFERRLLTYLGYPDIGITHTRSQLINKSEMIQLLLQSGEYLKSDYITKKTLDYLDDGDLAEDMINEINADELSRGGVINQVNEGGQNE